MTNMTWELEKPNSQIVTYNQSGSRYSESFRSRASLSEDQISRGNGDLLLRGAKVDDEGTYWCKVSTTGIYYRHSVDLTVEAPVSTVRIHQDGNRITCSSEGIYPEPELTWSIYPPSHTTLQNRTTVHQTEEKLYDISGSLTVPDEDPGLIYRCTVRTRRNQRTVFLNYQGKMCKTTAKADIVLLVDGSWSIGRLNFKTIRVFIARMVGVFDIGPDKIQIGLAQYSSDPKTEWHLNAHPTRDSLLNAVNNLPYKGGNTRTGMALNFILQNNFKEGVGMRPSARKIGVLVTDGESDDEVVIPSQSLREQGIELYAIGVKKADENELRSIASDPDDIHMYDVADFSFLLDIVDNLSDNLCNSVKGESGTKVSCLFNENCILPCRFKNGTTYTEWKHYNPQSQIVMYNQSGSRYSESFRSRASLSEDQISRGNGDLLLRGVKIDDEGRYVCIGKINGIKYRQSVELIVEAPESTVRIHQDENMITCSSEGIYPEPELTWSTEPPSNATLQNRTTVHQTEEKLYNISSSLTVPDGPDLIYSCSIRTRRNQRRATLTEPGAEVTICCTSLNISNSSLVWRFNHRQIILTKTDRNIYSVSEDWRKHVRIVSASGSLTLQDLTSDQEGVYSCELSDDEETIITHLYLRRTGENLVVSELIRRTEVCVVIAAAAAGFIMFYKKKMEESEALQL